VTFDSNSLDGVTGLEEMLDELDSAFILVGASQSASEGRGVSNASARMSSSERCEGEYIQERCGRSSCYGAIIRQEQERRLQQNVERSAIESRRLLPAVG
jgi:hypothetical protein